MEQKLTLVEISKLSQGINQWHSYLGSLSEREFYSLFTELPNFAQKVPSNFVISMAIKMLELGYLGDGLENETRQIFINNSRILYDFGSSGYDGEEKKKIHEAWNGSVDFCERFGYKSGAIYEILGPHKLFEE